MLLRLILNTREIFSSFTVLIAVLISLLIADRASLTIGGNNGKSEDDSASRRSALYSPVNYTQGRSLVSEMQITS